ncbi:sugar transferase [Demequina zhanjiangensis]|uniref:Sugar transferase n=1 Tax=Demequina zhanjiangensis TaxID=3051659 RepID=A0ABT8FZ04_9MICO|nr:sugar transferase [Demequina sp. SYSU T00b26]MDN4472047.1 sugar transferase [Demequina sp. SYSU T00b26]
MTAFAPSRNMSAGWVKGLQARILLADTFVVALVMVVAHGVRFGWDPFEPISGPAAPAYWWMTLAVGVLWVLELGWTRSRDVRVLGEGPEEYQRVGTAGWHTFAIVAVVGFLTQWQVSRGYLLFAIPVGTAIIFLYRRALRGLLREERASGRLRHRVIIAGPHRTTSQLVRRLQSNDSNICYDVVGVCLVDVGTPGRRSTDVPAASGTLLRGVPVLGDMAELPRTAADVGADFIILSGTDAVSLSEARKIEWELEDQGVGLIVAPTIADVAGPRVAVASVAGMQLMHVEAPRFRGGRRVLKTAADRLGAAAILAVLALPLAIVAASVKISSPGPVLYRQIRVGRDHQPFEMLKFRTMYTDAEERLAELRDSSDGNGVMFKMKDDPRVTPVGRILRRFSLDELPQLFNVLKGEMSIVGPRPPLPREVEQWEDHVSRRQLVKPGITGLWQVSGRSDLSWEESVRLDLHYTQNWTLGLDALILARTAWAVVAGRGAY